MVQAQGWCGQKLLIGWAQFEMFKCEICYKDGKDNILKKILEKEFFFISKKHGDMADIFCGIILIRKIFLNFDFFTGKMRSFYHLSMFQPMQRVKAY